MPQLLDSQRDHRTRNLVAAVLNDVWAIEPTKLEQIVAFLEMRAAGISPSEQDVLAAVRMQPRSSFDDMASGIDTMAGDRLVVDGVEVLQLFGTMGPRMNLMMEFSGGTSTQKLGQQIDRALADPNVKSILLEVDSPGGVITGTEELRSKLFESRGTKPLVAVGRGIVASAAYYVATAADELVVTPSTQVGSIGVFMITNDLTKMYDEMGVKFNVWRAGDLKAAGIQYESLTPDRAKAIQARVDVPYQMFLQAVAENRGVSLEKVKSEFGQGAVFMAHEALKRGMIDRIASIEDVFAELRQKSGVTRTPPTTSTGYRTSAANFSEKENGKMNKKIKAALYAIGMVDDANAADELCQAALNGFFRGNVPKGDEAILKGLTQQAAESVATATATLIPPADGDAKAQAKKDQEKAELLAAERERRLQIQAKAKILNDTGFAIDEPTIEKAIADGITPAEAADRWTKEAPKSGTGGEDPIRRVKATGSEIDKFHAAASDALLLRLNQTGKINLPSDFKPAPGAQQLTRAHVMHLVERDLQLAGASYDRYAQPEDIAAKWLQMQNDLFNVMGAEGGVTAANYPNLLSAFMNKTLDDKIRLQESTYRRWTTQQESVPDFNPRLVLGQSDAGYLPEIAGDGDPTPEGSTIEEALAWFQVHRRAKKLKLTPFMITQDQLGAFADEFGKLQATQDRTIDMMAYDLLTSNPTLLDGGQLFNTTATTTAGGHNNIIDTGTGAAPDAAQAKLVRTRMRLTPGIGTTDPIEVEPAIILVPIELEDSGKTTFLPQSLLTETLIKMTDSALNVHRGTMRDIIPSGRLSAASSVVWYALADPRLYPVIKYVFQRGYENGKRETWWDPDTQCRYFRHEVRLAVFVAGWRGAIKNMGV